MKQLAYKLQHSSPPHPLSYSFPLNPPLVAVPIAVPIIPHGFGSGTSEPRRPSRSGSRSRCWIWILQAHIQCQWQMQKKYSTPAKFSVLLMKGLVTLASDHQISNAAPGSPYPSPNPAAPGSYGRVWPGSTCSLRAPSQCTASR